LDDEIDLADRIYEALKKQIPEHPGVGWVLIEKIGPHLFPAWNDMEVTQHWNINLEIGDLDDPRFEAWGRYVRLKRPEDNPWPREAGEEIGISILLATYRRLQVGLPISNSEEIGAAIDRKPTTVAQASGGLVKRGLLERVGKQAYRLAVDEEVLLAVQGTRMGVISWRVTTLAQEAHTPPKTFQSPVSPDAQIAAYKLSLQATRDTITALKTQEAGYIEALRLLGFEEDVT